MFHGRLKTFCHPSLILISPNINLSWIRMLAEFIFISLNYRLLKLIIFSIEFSHPVDMPLSQNRQNQGLLSCNSPLIAYLFQSLFHYIWWHFYAVGDIFDALMTVSDDFLLLYPFRSLRHDDWFSWTLFHTTVAFFIKFLDNIINSLMISLEKPSNFSIWLTSLMPSFYSLSLKFTNFLTSMNFHDKI